MIELLLRFVLGGTIVSAFALGGEVFKPKTFAGLFGSAPSVAIGSLALALASEGAGYVTTEASAMAVGALGLFAYAVVCAFIIRRGANVWLGAVAAWSVWAVVSFGALFAVHALGGLR